MKKVNSKKDLIRLATQATSRCGSVTLAGKQRTVLFSDTLVPLRYSNREGKNGRRGFTIVELVVAMAIILIVSGTGIALIMTQTKVDSQASQTLDATNVCENAIECFRYAVNVSASDTKDEVVATFKEAFEKTGTLLGEPDENGKYTISSGAIIEITITEKTDENGINTHTITIYAVDSFDKEIFNKSYTK